MVRILLIVAAALLTTACATSFNTTVNSYAAEGLRPGQAHFILPSDAAQGADLQFAEVKAALGRSLTQAGLRLTDAEEEAEVAVFVEYGIGDPRTETTVVQMPVWGQTGVASSTTTGTARTFGSTTTVNATTNYTPSYGVVGYNNMPVTNTVFDRFLMVEAYDIAAHRADGKLVSLWKVTVQSSGSSGDLRYVIPYMLNSAVPYFGRSSGRAVTVVVPEGDTNVEYIRTGVLPGS
jgi:hypothetical protein